MLSVATSVILTKALVEINAADAGGTLQPELEALALDTLNQILDEWNADREKVYADSFLPFTIVPSQNPQTIGVGADWVTTQPPVSIEGIQINLGGSPPTFTYCKPRDAAWWQRQSSPQVTATIPTDFFYNPAWTPTNASPQGQVFLWPQPTVAYAVQVWCRVLLAQLTANQVISLPPGYNRTLMLTLAKALTGPLRKPWQAQQEQQLVTARRQIESNNTRIPRIRTMDAGMPKAVGHGNNWFYPDGSLTSR